MSWARKRLSSGERRFHATIKNIGSVACGANILLSGISASSIQSTGGVEPGEIKTFSKAVGAFGTLSGAPLLGLVPSGATSANPCLFRVRRTWYQRLRQGDVAQNVYLRYEVQNVGDIACSADVEMGSAAAGVNGTKTVGAGSSAGSKISGVTPATATYLVVPSPVEIGCSMEITRSFYRQVVTSSGASSREFQWTMKNLGTTSCSAERLTPKI